MKDLEDCLSIAQIVMKTTDINTLTIERQPQDTVPFKLSFYADELTQEVTKGLFHICEDYAVSLYVVSGRAYLI